jgi:hypothetical protein
MAIAEAYAGPERRSYDRSAGILLRRRQNVPIDPAAERRRSRTESFDIAGALEMHLDQVKTRRAMITLLESWLNETNQAPATERNEDYVQALEHAIEVITAAPDMLAGIAILQRSSD